MKQHHAWTRDRIAAAGVLALFLGLAFMRFVPGPEPGTALFALGAMAVSIVHWGSEAGSADAPDQSLRRRLSVGLLLALLASALVGMSAAHPLAATAKSAAPFLVLVWGLLVLVPWIPGAQRLDGLLVLAASVWAVRLIVAGVLDFLSDTSLNWLRLTLVDADAVVPFPLIIIPLILFSDWQAPRIWKVAALLLQLVIVAWTGYRSQQMLVAIMLLVALGRLVLQRPMLGTLVLLSLAGLAGYLVSNNTDATLLTAQFERFTTLSEETETSGRALERQFALDRFLDYPLLGAGLGVQVPASITYASTEITDDYELPETVSYLHNAPFFLIMTGGLPLLLAYLAVWVAAFLTTKNLWVRWALLALFAFIQVEATFLQVHFNVLLALLMGRQFMCAGPTVPCEAPAERPRRPCATAVPVAEAG